MDWCVVVYLLKKIATLSSETILFHVMPLQNDRSLSKPYKMGCCFFSCFTCFKRSGLQTAQNIFASTYTFSVPPSCPYKVRGPRRNSYNMVWCFVISCASSHLAEDTPREALKRKCEFKVILSICVVFLFPRPPSCHIMPLQNDRFPSNHLQDGLALWFFFRSNMQLKTLDSSKLLGS